MGVLLAIVVPNVGGFFGAGQEQSYKSAQQTLQTAVNAFRTDSNNTGNKYPTLAMFDRPADNADDCTGGKGIGAPSATCASFIDVAVLVTGSGSIPGGFLQSMDAVKSADTAKNTTATNSPAGSYGWYVDANGLVQSSYGATHTTGFQNVYP
jgi:type II secretory pathway pseudopilin PulG